MLFSKLLGLATVGARARSACVISVERASKDAHAHALTDNIITQIIIEIKVGVNSNSVDAHDKTGKQKHCFFGLFVCSNSKTASELFTNRRGNHVY